MGMAAEPTPFRIEIPQADVADLGERLRRTRWPERETVGDWSQGVPLAYVQDMCRYWADGYDWRASLRWAQRRFPDIRYWGEPARGGHFAAFEQPDLFVNEICSFFRLIR
jgi:pimeloyl-ACP methyl ester carboxylesterase